LLGGGDEVGSHDWQKRLKLLETYEIVKTGLLM
jgi:hypothetical protein